MTSPAPKRPRGRPRLPLDERGEVLTLRVPVTLRARAQAAADGDGVDLSEWIREAMDEKARGER